MTTRRMFTVWELVLLCTCSSIMPAHADSTKLANPDNQHLYQRFDAKKTWREAKQSCANQGGYLATIGSKAENDWVWHSFGGDTTVYFKNLKGFWLGGTDEKQEGRWTWVTGEAWTYTNWAHGQPDSFGAGQNYLVMWDGGQWDDTGLPHMDLLVSYLCEWDHPLNTFTGLIVADTNGDHAGEFILFGNNGIVSKVVAIDRKSRKVTSNVSFATYPGSVAVSVSVIDDKNRNGRAEFAVLLNNKDGSSVIQVRDSGTGELLEQYAVPR